MSKRKRSRSKKHRSSNSVLVWALLVLLLIAVGAIGAVIYYYVDNAPTYNEATLCPQSGPTSSMVILLDLTDPVTATQSRTLYRLLHEHVDAAPAGTLISVGVVSESSSEWGAQFSRCKPETGADASVIYQNPRLIADQFESGFVIPFRIALDGMLEAEEQSRSPIVESLQLLVEDSLSMSGGRSPTHLIIVSDLIQNSDRVSFYACQGWEHFRSSGDTLTRNLAGTHISLARISRPGGSSCVSAELEPFWSRYLDAKGAVAPFEITVLGDL